MCGVIRRDCFILIVMRELAIIKILIIIVNDNNFTCWNFHDKEFTQVIGYVMSSIKLT